MKYKLWETIAKYTFLMAIKRSTLFGFSSQSQSSQSLTITSIYTPNRNISVALDSRHYAQSCSMFYYILTVSSILPKSTVVQLRYRQIDLCLLHFFQLLSFLRGAHNIRMITVKSQTKQRRNHHQCHDHNNDCLRCRVHFT